MVYYPPRNLRERLDEGSKRLTSGAKSFASKSGSVLKRTGGIAASGAAEIARKKFNPTNEELKGRIEREKLKADLEKQKSRQVKYRKASGPKYDVFTGQRIDVTPKRKQKTSNAERKEAARELKEIRWFDFI